MKKLIWGIVIIVLFFICFALFTYSVDETKLAIRTRFGKIIEVNKEPGLYFKIPFIDQVETMERRIMLYDINPESILTATKKRLEVDNYVMWKIEDPQLFYETMRTLSGALTRIDDIVYSNLRDAFAKLEIGDIISEARRENLSNITVNTAANLAQFGLEIVDVNVKRTDLPEANANAVFERMQSERYKAATKIRAEGEKQAKDIMARAEKDSEIIMATAFKTAEEIRGTGDAEAIEIYANAFSKDPDFYKFWRVMSAYETSFVKNTSIVLGDGVQFLDELVGGK